MSDTAELSRDELAAECERLRQIVRHSGGGGGVPQALLRALADVAALRQQIAAMQMEPSHKDALIRQQARRIHCQRLTNRANWEIVEMRDKWRYTLLRIKRRPGLTSAIHKAVCEWMNSSREASHE